MKKTPFYLLVFLFAVAVVFPGARFAPPQKAEQTAAVTFTITKAFWDVEGAFHEIDYAIDFDPGNLSAAKIEGAVKVGSIDTGNDARDKQLQDKEWFDAYRYPEIRVECAKVSALENGVFEGEFYISMKGERRLQKLPFRVEESDGARVLKSTFSLDRDDWGVGGGAFAAVVGEKVRVSVSLPF